MKKNIYFFNIAAAFILTAVMMTGCKQAAAVETAKQNSFHIALKSGAHGTLTADPALPADGMVAKDAALTFTAVPDRDYEVDTWTGATQDSTDKNKAHLKVAAHTTVSVTFRAKAADTSLLKINAEGVLSGVTDKNALAGSLVIPNTVTRIDDNALSGCIRLTNIIIPNSVTEIDYKAFAGCLRLTHIAIPDSVQNISSKAFAGCADLESVTIGKGVYSLSGDAFQECPRLTGISVDPENTSYCHENNMVYSKDKEAIVFAAANSATGTFTVPNGVERIEHNAFSNCSELMNVTLPATVSDLASSAFAGCAKLRSISVDSANTAYCSIGGIVYSHDKKAITAIPEGLSGTVTLPDELKEIGWDAFENRTGLTGVTIGAGVTSIRYNAFRNCSSLTHITIKSAVLTNIDGGAFNGIKENVQFTVKTNEVKELLKTQCNIADGQITVNPSL